MRHVTAAIAVLFALATPLFAQDEPPEVTQIREMVPGLKKKLEEMRGKTFDREVDVRYQTDEDFRAYMQEKIDADYPEEKAQADVKLLAAVGLLPPTYDMRKEMVDAMASQALAYYEPSKNAFFVLKTSMPMEMIAPTVLHELQHALQDQKFDLGAGMEKFSEKNFDREDQALAYRFLVEGEATYLMTKFGLEQAGQEAMLSMALKMQAETSRKQLSQMERMQAGMLGAKGKAMLEALDARDRLPGYLYHNLVGPYMQGAYFVHQVVEAHGMEALDELFTSSLPTSSEQALHPEKAFGPGRDEPTFLELPDLSEALSKPLVCKNSLGELNIRVMFEEMGVGPQKDAAAGWDGDRIHAYAKKGDKWATIVWALTFDSEKDAKEFADALEKNKAKGPKPLSGADVTVEGVDVLVLGNVSAGKRDAVRKAARAGLTREGGE